MCRAELSRKAFASCGQTNLLDIVVRGQKNQKYKRAFRKVISLPPGLDKKKKKDMEDGQFQCRTDRGRNVFTRKRRIKLHTYQLPQAHAVLYSAVAAYECSPRGLKLKTDPRAFAGGGKRSAGQSPSEHPTKVYPLSSPPVLRCPCIT